MNTEVEQITYVSAGEVIVRANKEWLISTPLGSCVAVIAYDITTKTGGIAHVMLPGQALVHNKTDSRFRYAADAIEHLFAGLQQKEVLYENIDVCLVGGANVLKKKNDGIALEVANSVLNIMVKKQIVLHAVALGGYERHTVSLNLDTGTVYYTIGDSPEIILCKFELDGKVKREKIINLD
ncbi:MAG: hypothetical protein DRJ09_12625 [Bacteroidetes bacterium]|nr:MAG: hypothetical protein DRJ09_12625 [Bacteroidota bacterium]